ncbi:MAG TPA: hypothetical protein VNL13_03855 [Sulfolobales archaeon]|nr:hypothetical protein [Sulfolobales archaeon]
MSSGDVDDIKKEIDEAFRRIEERIEELERKIETHDPFLTARGAMRDLRHILRDLRHVLHDITDRIEDLRDRGKGEEFEKTIRDLENYVEKKIYDMRDRLRELTDRIRSRYGVGKSMGRMIGISMLPLRIAEDIGRTVSRALEESIEAIEQAVGKASTTVLSVRIRDDDLKVIDSLVDSGVFRSRSEAVAFFTHKGIECSKDWIERTKDKIEKIKQLQDEIRLEIEGKKREEQKSDKE